MKKSNREHGVSEYQLYFNFVTINYWHQIRIRLLRYKNTANFDLKRYNKFPRRYDYCSFHSYLSPEKKSSRSLIPSSLAKFFYKMFIVEKWNVGIINNNISSLINMPMQQIHWLKERRGSNFIADPFGIIEADKKSILCEYYNFWRKKGEICQISLNNNFAALNKDFADTKLSIQTVIKDKFHYSYPHPIKQEGKTFFLVESCKQNKVILHEFCDGKVINKITILENISAIDPSIISFEGKWWLFFVDASLECENLSIAFSDNLFYGWKMHPKNPIKLGNSRVRNGGEIFLHQGSLFRPSQDCSLVYGRSLIINKISKISESEYEEIKETEIFPDQLAEYSKGLHHISSLGKDLTLIDGKRAYFSMLKPIFSIVRNLSKKLFKTLY